MKSRVSYDSLLIHRCTVQRSSSVLDDVLGQPIVTWANHLTNVPCRYYPKEAAKAIEQETVHLTDVPSYYVLHTRRRDISEADRITNITAGGNVLDAGPFDIELVRYRADSLGGHHLELLMKRVGPTAYQDPTA